MRGVQGLVIAVVFGVVGAFCNWMYISRLAHDYEKASFVAVKDQDVQINLGDRLKVEHFMKVDIPKSSVGNLDKVAIRWSELDTVKDLNATRSYRGGEILFWRDLKAPGNRPLSDKLGKDEDAAWVAISSGDFVPEMINPGDLVSFVVPRLPGGQPVEARNAKALLSQPTESIGPFRVLALGTRTGKREVRQARGLSSGPEHIITISIRRDREGQMEPRAERLFKVLDLTGRKAARLILHSAKMKE